MNSFQYGELPEKIRQELELARLVQENASPKFIPRVPGFKIITGSRPAGWNNGDAIDVIGLRPLEDKPGWTLDTSREVDNLTLMLADASGHGMGPALMATELRSMTRACIRLGVFHRDLMCAVNTQLLEDLDPGHFITMLLGRVSAQHRLFRWCSFGQAPLFFYHAATGEVEVFGSHMPPLGILEEIGEYELTETHFQPGDQFIALSDGYLEAGNAQQELWGTERAVQLIKSAGTGGVENVAKALEESITVHAGGHPQTDDQSYLMIEALQVPDIH